jgi:hypothetical protein
MDPLLTSLMQHAAYKCGTLRFKLKSSANYELSNVVSGQQFKKLLSLNKPIGPAALLTWTDRQSAQYIFIAMFVHM